MESNSEQVLSKVGFSTPAKFILSGEHSVVYGKDAIVATVDLRTFGWCTLKFDTGNKKEAFQIKLNDINQEIELSHKEVDAIMSSEEDWKKVESFSSFVEIFQTRITQETGIKDIEAISKDQKIHFLYFLVRSFHHMIKRHNLGSQEKEKILKNFSNSNINLSIRSQLPISKGIGSSASFLVTVSACLLSSWENLKLFTETPSSPPNFSIENINSFKEYVNELAYDFECIFHGKPSGLDNTSVTFGGVNSFNRAENTRQNINLGFLEDYHIILIDSGIEKNTKRAVSMVRGMVEDPLIGAAAKSIIDSIGVTSKSIIGLIGSCPSLKEDQTGKIEERFAQLIRFNHYLLKSLNLSTKEIDSIINICDQFGFPSKLTGAGQGGYCVSFIPKYKEINGLLEALKHSGFETMELSFEKRGLSFEIKTEEELFPKAGKL